MDQGCPKCNALPDEMCTTATGRTRNDHAARQTGDPPMTAVRSERNAASRDERGNTADRRRRREWLVETFAADVAAQPCCDLPGCHAFTALPDGEPGEPACRCYRCGRLLTVDTVTADRIIPGCKGGTYRRNNIRPACMECNRDAGSGYRR